jgi:cytochrome c oxidase assembly protein subunit 19
MASTTFGQKIFQPKPPIQGSFPLDHEGECKEKMLEYVLCMSKSKNDSSKCRNQAKEYLECRMSRNLMEKQPLDTFGYEDNANKKNDQK